MIDLPGGLVALDILTRLPADIRRLAATAVCKGWQQAAAAEPSLWADVTISDAGPGAAAASCINWEAVAAWLARHGRHTSRLQLQMGNPHLQAVAAAGSAGDSGVAGSSHTAADAVQALSASLQELSVHGSSTPPSQLLLPAISRCQQLQVLQLDQLPGGFWPLADVAALAALPRLARVSVAAGNLFLHNSPPLLERRPPLQQLDVSLPDPLAVEAAMQRAAAHASAAASAAGPAAGPGGPHAAASQQHYPQQVQPACSTDDLLMMGVLNMMSALAGVLFAMAGEAAGGPPGQPSAGTSSLELLMGGKGSVSVTWRAGGARSGGAAGALTLVNQHMQLVFVAASSGGGSASGGGDAAAAGAVGAPMQAHMGTRANHVLRLLESSVDVQSARQALLQPEGLL